MFVSKFNHFLHLLEIIIYKKKENDVGCEVYTYSVLPVLESKFKFKTE